MTRLVHPTSAGMERVIIVDELEFTHLEIHVEMESGILSYFLDAAHHDRLLGGQPGCLSARLGCVDGVGLEGDA
jgi:hypothetical protein